MAAGISTLTTQEKNPQEQSSEETHFGSKLIQALAEYSGRFPNEFKKHEPDTK